MDIELQQLDKVKWNSQEDDLLLKLQKHFQNDFSQISSQMNKIFFYNKMTPSLCEYRWRYYIDSNINRSEFNQAEEHSMFQQMKRNDLYTNQFWFELSDQFQKRPPSVLKVCTMKFIIKYLIGLSESYVQNKAVKKRYMARIKQFNIDIMITFFRLGKEKQKRTGPPTLLGQGIDQCTQLLLYLEQMISTRGQMSKYDDQSEQASIKFHSMMECLIFIDTIFRIFHKISPYNQGEQAERDKMETLLPSKKSTLSLHDDRGYEDQAFEQLNKEDVRLIYNSEALQTFQQYFSTNE
ncbi:unnamed protein product (macronuclear) [Paramecium tetraurelia]|uniref:Chromosome undetermined scaffold_112, whole genome shotgun sequence n=1 Tax=Paramecium tetraurelia TaxID=5888 RepID=A0BKM9_PARTE|nr:uncharacterized protein GSPATT00029727001 [Paramecium tetraurelia]XP_001441651.1 uncharacterized protein GSPATT00038987001 [Paramecium tetraurelia]CAK59096.1 unnamed protein product [Paramecium tetraurelia]CAK74254.1 unnamed protein product [Paramecium tetraurelia]|eukprot:XP_001426494.1 hypothetical protein (macronuclear) [Paramecium tetraurelia strain d4-2]